MILTIEFFNRLAAPSYVCLDRPDQAGAAIEELLEYDPDYSIAKFRMDMGVRYKNPADLERWIDDLRAAGLPE